mgnify:CR=1 FL=1
MTEKDRPYSCETCLAACTFEAMMQCPLEKEACPTFQLLAQGKIVDRRPTDFDPEFPSVFSWAAASEVGSC